MTLPLEPLHVLLVDDHEDSCELLTVVLEQQGHRVMTAHDGERAIELLREQPFDVAVIDIGLPVMDGYEVARQARTLGDGKVPHLIALTGYSARDDIEATKKAGFDRHLVKPVNVDVFAAAVAECRRAR
jgi:CheY-like chemotaxis protein